MNLMTIIVFGRPFSHFTSADPPSPAQLPDETQSVAIVVQEQQNRHHLQSTSKMETLEALTTRRECIVNIMNLLNNSDESEKKENERKVQAELMLDLNNTAKTVDKKLQEILDTIEKQIKNINTENIGNIQKTTYLPREFSISLTKMSLSTITTKASRASREKYVRNTVGNTWNKEINIKKVSLISLAPEELMKMKEYYLNLLNVKTKQTKRNFASFLQADKKRKSVEDNCELVAELKRPCLSVDYDADP